METKYSNKINILIVYFISILSFFINEELFALTETDKILTEILQRYSFTNKAGNKVYFEFHYDEKIEGLNKNNPVHINQMFILFDLIDFWNTYIRGDFNMGNYIDNKPLFDAIHFSNKRINSISFHEIIQNENIIVVKHNLKYIENPILGSLTIKSFDSDNYGSATYNHWPGASNSYIFKYHKIEN